MKCFIIGASGLVGSHCLRVFKGNKIESIGTYFNYQVDDTVFFDPLEENSIEYLYTFNPDVIIHCGALTNVDYCEENELESYRLTVESTNKIVDYCKKENKKLVYFSTDYVFDGASGPYREDSSVNPINIYGKHKLEAENLVSLLENYIIARITNVYGEEARNKNFISRLLDILDRRIETTMNLPVDQFATPVYAGDLAEMVYLLIKDDKKGIYNLSSTDYFNRYVLASKTKLSRLDNDNLELVPILTSKLKQKALRPLKGGLLNDKFSLEYPEFMYTSIDSYLSIKNKNNKI